MKRVIILVLVISLLLTLSLVTTLGVSAKQDVFTGAWTGVDTEDGSNWRFLINGGGGGSYRFVILDDSSSACGGVPAIGRGTATADGNVLTATIAWWCLSGKPWLFDTFDLDFTYNQDGTLTGAAVILNRMGAR